MCVAASACHARSERVVGQPNRRHLPLSQDVETEAEHDLNFTGAASAVGDEIQVTPDVLGGFLTDLTEIEEEGRLPSTGQGTARDFQSKPQDTAQSDITMSPETPWSNIPWRQSQAVLETILATLDHFSQSSSLRDWDKTENYKNDKGTYDLSPSDIANILTSPWMGLSLLDGQNQDNQEAFHHRIILSFEAAITLGQHKVDKKDTDANKIEKHIEDIKTQKLHNALAKLDQMSFRTPPSLSLLQAQCIGVAILQYLGNVPQAWSMMVAVSRTFIALGFSNADSSRPVSRGESVERCIAWCYQLDRSMSLLLRQPPFLPQLLSAPPSISSDEIETDPAKLDLVQILLEFAHIQGYISPIASGTKTIVWEDIQPTHSSLIKLYSKIENLRSLSLISCFWISGITQHRQFFYSDAPNYPPAARSNDRC
ncbi:hypothetical protein UA08_03342 [Talaromyces atroroseus]|uniref:Xylanolytic transcriptional activator regulatory domain-containing protein n=1 Tax=Talaromyces atroroseus TaxID=1441469 RepID=A0A225AJM8_TALAT|nr:hypothetical protein UA08_03342 [Talaromyces atroroseus]OKL61070.1 hypothetical protein UA08_03342 [Talaromyces atroroseus]